MATLEEFEAWVMAQGGPGDLADKIKGRFGPDTPISQPAISNWISRGKVSKDGQKYLDAFGWHGPWEWKKAVTPALPGPHAAEAWRIIREAAIASQTDLMAPVLVEVVGELFDSIADAVAQGRGEEARQRLVRKAEVTFLALKK